MLNCKRVLAAALGLFLLPRFPLAADENSGFPIMEGADSIARVSAETGTLWVEDDAAAVYWHSGLHIARNKNGKKIYLDTELGQAISNLPWAEGTVWGYRGVLGFDTAPAGFTVGSGFFSHSFFNIETGGASLYNNGGNGYCISAAVPVHIGKLNIEPSFAYGRAKWDEGSLYWFFGKPDIPALSLYGLSARFDRHTAGFYYLSLEINIANNEHIPLFDSRINAYALYYTFSLEKRNLGFTGTLGWLYAGAAADGALTASNQHYALFPFLFYKVNAALNVHTGFAMFELNYKHPPFQYQIKLGAAHIFYGEGKAHIHYQMKNLFGRTEAFEEIPLKANGTGAALMVCDFGMPALRIGKPHTRLSLGLQKAFGIPWGYQQFFSDQNASPDASAFSREETAKLVKTALLSGWSLYGSVSF